MASSVFSSLFEVQSTDPSTEPLPGPPSAPAKALPRTYPGVPQRDDSIELQRIQLTPRGNDSLSRASSPPPFGADLEMSRPGSPTLQDEGVEVLQTVWDPYMNRFRLAAACLMNFGNGLHDSAPGALIPHIEKQYNIGYAIVSLIFVSNAFGFIFGALFLDTLRVKLGRAKLLCLGQLTIALAYIPILAQAPFPLIAMVFFLVGFGTSINLAMSNVFCGQLRNGTTALGYLHGCYGIGGTVGPLIATALVTVGGENWSRYYLLTMAFAVFTSAFSTWSFWNYEKEMGQTAQLLQEREAERDSNQLLNMFSSLQIRIVLLGAIFIFAYQGAEVSISGWVISFLVSAREGNLSSIGYVTSGFWGGITVGRFVLSGLAHKIGEKLFVYLTVVGAAVFQLLVWWVPNIVGNAVSLAIVGLLLGPVYPCAAAVFMQGMSRKERVSGMGVISAFGSSGGAVAPFTTGILAQGVGTFVLHPIAIGLFAGMLLCWYGIPHMRKRNE